MIYEKWKQEAIDKLQKLPTRELQSIANSTDPDARLLANEILKERSNRPVNTSIRIGRTDEDFYNDDSCND